DRERGMAWQVPLLALDTTTVPLMAAAVGDLRVVTQALRAHRGRAGAPGRGRQHPVPLEFEYRETPLHETIDELVKSGRAPIYLVNCWERGAADQAQNLMSVDMSSKAEKDAIRAALDGAAFDTPYGKDF